jgi:carboxypeptidase Q
MLRRKLSAALIFCALLLPTLTLGQSASATSAVGGSYVAPADVIDKIKDEGMNRSQVMQTLGYLSDVIGPRLTASPGMKRGNDWTRDTLAKWGMSNAHLEPWGPFGRGWSLKKFYAMVDGPTAFPLIAYPKAWSPGTETLIPPPKAPITKVKNPAPVPAGTVLGDTSYTAEVVRFTATKAEELDQYKGKLRGKIVLVGPMRELKAHFEPDAKRNTDKELLDLADARDPNLPRPAATPNPAFANFATTQQFNAQRLRFLSEEGAAVLVDAARGDYGTVFVQQAAAVQPAPPPAGTPPAPAIRIYDKGAIIPVQISAAAEHFNRLARMVDAGEHPTMTVDLRVAYQDQDLNGYNTVAEIPGTDKADEIVMLGGHLDSWQGGTGATDNGAGCAVMMEAMRIIKTLGLAPRRTIRIALWTGEEQGLLGSREYVKDHFGWRGATRPPIFNAGGGGGQGQQQQPQPVTKGADYDKLSAYFNIDNGTGRIRGVYMQGNDAVRPIFRSWLESFRDPKWFDKDHDLGAYTLSLDNTGGTDHLSFDAIGLPGFQFIQDPIDYDTRTHHSNMDVFDRVQADDMKQIATIVAAFVYQAAMMDDKMPKKANAPK